MIHFEMQFDTLLMNVDPLESDAACVPVDSELTSAGAAGGAVTVSLLRHW